jgi:hypothetical protein
LRRLVVAVAIIVLPGLAAIHPVLYSTLGGQLIVVCIGIIHYLYGVHRDRNFLWLGMLLPVGGVTLLFIPFYPWKCPGIVIALRLVIPTFFRRRNHVQQH